MDSFISTAGSGGYGSPDDSLADDCAAGFLSDLDEALWLLAEAQQMPGAGFTDALRRADHVEELRRLLHRLHQVLAEWEHCAVGAAPRPPGVRRDGLEPL